MLQVGLIYRYCVPVTVTAVYRYFVICSVTVTAVYRYFVPVTVTALYRYCVPVTVTAVYRYFVTCSVTVTALYGYFVICSVTVTALYGYFVICSVTVTALYRYFVPVTVTAVYRYFVTCSVTVTALYGYFVICSVTVTAVYRYFVTLTVTAVYRHFVTCSVTVTALYRYFVPVTVTALYRYCVPVTVTALYRYCVPVTVTALYRYFVPVTVTALYRYFVPVTVTALYRYCVPVTVTALYRYCVPVTVTALYRYFVTCSVTVTALYRYSVPVTVTALYRYCVPVTVTALYRYCVPVTVTALYRYCVPVTVTALYRYCVPVTVTALYRYCVPVTVTALYRYCVPVTVTALYRYFVPVTVTALYRYCVPVTVTALCRYCVPVTVTALCRYCVPVTVTALYRYFVPVTVTALYRYCVPVTVTALYRYCVPVTVTALYRYFLPVTVTALYRYCVPVTVTALYRYFVPVTVTALYRYCVPVTVTALYRYCVPVTVTALYRYCVPVTVTALYRYCVPVTVTALYRYCVPVTVTALYRYCVPVTVTAVYRYCVPVTVTALYRYCVPVTVTALYRYCVPVTVTALYRYFVPVTVTALYRYCVPVTVTALYRYCVPVTVTALYRYCVPVTVTALMKLLLVLLLAALVSSQSHRDPLARMTDKVTRSLHQVLGSEDSNFFISPFSISMALSMLYAGASGQTAVQIAQLFQGNKMVMDRMSRYFKYELSRPYSGANILEIAAAVWLKQNASILPSYKEILTSDYNSTISNVDFASNGEQVKNEINEWVSTKTKQKIPTLLDKPLNPDTVLFLANAIYFKGKWEEEFEKTFTQSQNFYNNGDENQKRKVQMMHKESEILYHTNYLFKAVQLNYKSSELSMIVILPIKFGDLERVEKNLPENFLENIRFFFTKMDVFLPKFRIEYKKELKEAFQKVGLTSPFDDSADFSGITGQKNVKVSEISHKTFVEVDEEGTEAAAVTGVRIVPLSVNFQPVFNVNQPFLFYIIDNTSRTILFAGRIKELHRDPLARMTDKVTRSLHQVLGSEDSNFFISPFSISMALSMLYAGASGQTAVQIAQLFQGNKMVMDRMSRYFKYELSRPYSGANILEIAAAVWLKQNASILPSYKEILTSDYNSTISNVDFASNGEQVKNEINEWVSTKTKQKIPTLLDKPLNPDTVLFLANAIYFKGKWEEEFDKKFTQSQNFYNNGDENQKKKVQMMHKESEILYHTNYLFKAVQLNYKSSELSMIVILPIKFGDLERVEKNLPENFLENIRFFFTKMDVFLPKFRIEYKKELKEAFQKVGLTSPFDDSADFSGITGQKNVKVSEISHKTFVEVDEEGTEAAAVTGVRIVPLSVNFQPVFNVNQPFLFYIIDNTSRTILFAGRIKE
ncbi:SRPN10, partial [Cordylochernes scorpioides]